jgi:hypothetical protein
MIVGARAKNEGQGQRSNRYKVSEVNIISRPKGYMRNKRPKKEERQERIEYEESLQHMAEEEGEEGRKEGRGEGGTTDPTSLFGYRSRSCSRSHDRRRAG